MKQIYSISLNFWLPILVVAAFACLWLLLLWKEYTYAHSNLIASNKYFLTQDLSFLKREMDSHIRSGRKLEAGHALSARGTNVHYRILVATDDQGMIVHATSLALLGQPINKVVTNFKPSVFKKIQQTQNSQVYYDSELTEFSAYFPLIQSRTSKEIRATKVGVLFAIYTLQEEKENLWQIAIYSGFIVAGFLLLAMSVLMFFLYIFVTKPARQLSELSHLFAKDMSIIDYVVKGSGEFAELGKAFQRMIVLLNKQFTELIQTHTALREHQDRLEQIVEERTQSLEKTNQSLKESQLRLAEAQRLAGLGSWSLNLLTNELKWSDEIYRIFEINPEQFNASYEVFINIIHPEDQEFVKKAYTESLTNKSTYAIEHRLLMKDGRIKYVSEQGETIYDNHGKVIQKIGTVLDITQRTLDKMQITQAKEEAEFANRQKSLFLANISHELRTPLHGILSFANFGLNKGNTVSREKLIRYFTNISVSGERLLVLINDLLDISKIEANKLVLNIEESDLADVFDDCLVEQKQRIHDLGLTIEVNKPDFPLVAEFDPKRIAQVMTNLLSNAIKFSSDGDTIKITMNKKNQQLFFTIQDQGLGIPSDELEHIFGNFVQSSNTYSGSGGTGLGLGISKAIIEAHNGKIWAINHPQGGAIFKFVI